MTAIIKCIIIEDEPLAAEILVDYIQALPNFNLLAKFNSALEAKHYLNENEVDLIFLDLHLPKLKGLDFLQITKPEAKIIITTAYQQYALDGYRFNVIDYLLKPFSFDRFFEAVQKIEAKKVNLSNPNYAFFNFNKKMIKVIFDDIIYVESKREYVSLICNSNKVLLKMSISEIETMLPTNNFIRIHRSYIVNKNKVNTYAMAEIEVNNIILPIGITYKDDVLLKLKKN